MKSGRRLAFLSIVSATLVVAGSWPIETKVSVAWKARVITDETGEPLPGCRVRQYWQQYTFEELGHEDEVRTDGAGGFELPERLLRASTFNRIIGAVQNLTLGVHASFGAESSVSVSCRGYETAWVKPGDSGTPPKVIAVKRHPN